MKIIIAILFFFPMMVFANTTTYFCNYSSYSNQAGNHKVKNKFQFSFLVDKTTGKAYLLGSIGSSEVEMFVSNDRVAFLEITETGNIMTTAIDSKLNSVHSRNTVLLGEILPSQYYGKCEVK